MLKYNDKFVCFPQMRFSNEYIKYCSENPRLKENPEWSDFYDQEYPKDGRPCFWNSWVGAWKWHHACHVTLLLALGDKSSTNLYLVEDLSQQFKGVSVINSNTLELIIRQYVNENLKKGDHYINRGAGSPRGYREWGFGKTKNGTVKVHTPHFVDYQTSSYYHCYR